ncbi:MAG: hypothetical protein MUC76_01215 [Spirochaetes bacterium]|jgi:hypothetical protein|nr:hypothetical protein [Spirochaetota bacterium]
MAEQLSYYSKMVMQEFHDYYGVQLHPGVTMNVLIIRDLVPRNQREAVFNELLEDLEFLEMLPAFPGKLILTQIGFHYLLNCRVETLN